LSAQKEKEMKMQATFAANLAVLKEQKPSLYEEIKNYQATDTKAAFDASGNLNLCNNGKFVYPDNPKELAKKQVLSFLTNPSSFDLEIKHQADKDINFRHSALLKSIQNVRLAEAENNIKPPASEQQLDFVCFLGGGLGYQIEALLNIKNVLNVFLFEPDKGSFFALLHSIELKPLFDRCTRRGGEFSIQIGGHENNVINNISTLLINQGHFNLGQMLVFKHYNSPLIERTIKSVKSMGYRWGSGWGFFEDEIIGISHTILNLKAKHPILKKTSLITNPLEHKPVFIVANGPSLDSAIRFLKENQDKIIIISCGTALKALLINNISPDIHVEMERVADLLKYVKVIERTENITIRSNQLNIVALNTVYEGVLKLFKSAHLLGKLNDAGGQLIQSLDDKEVFNYPKYTNPTVSNTGVALATALGFKELYLVGTDFGFASQEHHHSKYSIYFDKDFQNKDKVNRRMQSNMVVKGNFRDEVFSTNGLDASKGNIELLLQDQPQVTAFNTSDGAYIQFTTPIKIDDINIQSPIENKQELITSLLNDSASSEQLSAEDVDLKVTEIINKVKSTLEQLLSITTPNFTSREGLSAAFAVQNKILLHLSNGNEDNKLVYILIQGTFKYFQTYIMTNCYYYHDLEKRNNFINACVGAFQAHLSELYLEFINNYNKPSKV